MATITWTQTPTMYEITLPSGNSYYIEDNEVRQWIGTGSTSGAEYRISELETAISKLSNATHWLGITTTPLTDGATTNPITIGGSSVTAKSGDIVQTSSRAEFIFNGTAWQELGTSVGTLKAFAYADTGEVTIKPKGSNSTSSVSGTCSVTPSGSISTGTGTANYTPAGSVSGSVTAPTISVKTAGSTASVKPFGSAGTLPSCTLPTYTVANGVLTITAGSFSAGTLPSAGTEVTVKTGDAAYEATAPTFSGSFSGTGTQLKFTGSASSGTISGTAAAQTFTGTEETHTVTPAT
jgi:hypothetical protein